MVTSTAVVLEAFPSKESMAKLPKEMSVPQGVVARKIPLVNEPEGASS